MLPAFTRRAFTPIETLTYVASHTRRIALCTSILSMPLHNPVMLARQLATLDVLSGGRLRVGLGQGWSVDELEAGGIVAGRRAARADEFIAVLKAVWATDPAEYFTLPKSSSSPNRSSSRTRRSTWVVTPRAPSRVARLADGWIPTAVSLAKLGPMMGEIRE